MEKATGVSVGGILDAFSGEGIVYVRPAGTAPEVTLVLAPPDPDKVWQTVDRLAHTLAEQSGTTVRTVEEDGRDVSLVDADGATVRYAQLDDDTVIVTTGVTGIRDFAGDGDKLDSSDAYRRAADAVGLGDRTGGFLYVDVDGLLPIVDGCRGRRPLGRRPRGDPEARRVRPRSVPRRRDNDPDGVPPAERLSTTRVRRMLQRQSILFLPTLREDPADAEAVSHKLLVRAGLIRQVGTGLWTYLPAGWRDPREGRPGDPRGDGRDRRAGDVDAGADARPSCGRRPGGIRIPELFHVEDRSGP